MILDEIRRFVDSLGYRPDIDITKLCYLAEKHEWDELVAYHRSTRRFGSEHDLSGIGPTKMFCCHLEIRKR